MSLEHQKEEKSDLEDMEESAALQQAEDRLPVFSFVLIGCLIAVAIAQIVIDGQSFFLAGAKSGLIAGFVKPLFREGQYWRILTGVSLHGGLLHLGFNCYALYTLGKLIEILSNRAHLAIIFILSAIGGNILSLIFTDNLLSVGASGGIVGFLGYLAVYGYRRRALLSNAFLKNMLLNIGFMAVYGIVLYRFIDNFAHLGGLLVGALYGAFQISGDVYKDPRTVSPLTKFLGSAALGIFILVSIFSIFVLLGFYKVEIPQIYFSLIKDA